MHDTSIESLFHKNSVYVINFAISSSYKGSGTIRSIRQVAY